MDLEKFEQWKKDRDEFGGTDTFPKEADVIECLKILEQYKDLCIELERIGISTLDVALLAAVYRYRKRIVDHARSDRERKDESVRNSRKYRKREKRDIPFDDPAKWSRIADQERERHAARKTAERAGAFSKKDPAYHRLVKNLHSLLTPKTKKPYRYLAGIISLYRLHPEEFCYTIEKVKDPDHSQKVKRVKTVCMHRGDASCTREKILLCPNHKQAREAIAKIVKSTD